jgi:hypothetical protein
MVSKAPDWDDLRTKGSIIVRSRGQEDQKVRGQGAEVLNPRGPKGSKGKENRGPKWKGLR